MYQDKLRRADFKCPLCRQNYGDTEFAVFRECKVEQCKVMVTLQMVVDAMVRVAVAGESGARHAGTAFSMDAARVLLESTPWSNALYPPMEYATHIGDMVCILLDLMNSIGTVTRSKQALYASLCNLMSAIHANPIIHISVTRN